MGASKSSKLNGNHQRARRARSESSEILATRRNASGALGSSWPTIETGISPTTGEHVAVIMGRATDAPKLGARRWRDNHKNLAKPILRSKRAKIIT